MGWAIEEDIVGGEACVRYTSVPSPLPRFQPLNRTNVPSCFIPPPRALASVFLALPHLPSVTPDGRTRPQATSQKENLK